MRYARTAAAFAVLTLAGAGGARAQASGAARSPATGSAVSPAMPRAVATAVADPSRPSVDRARDIDRHPAEVTAFAGVGPGETVVDLIPGGGYFTRIFAKAVGPSGKVYALIPTLAAKMHPEDVAAIRAFAAHSPNVIVLVEGVGKLATHGPIDVVWTAQNYHDLHNPAAPASTALDVDHAVFAALKPGGSFVIEDHVAASGSGIRDAGTLHRIDPAFVRDEVQSAGFTFDAESPALTNPADPHTAKVFDPVIRGHTDQFVFKFSKPGAM